MDFHILGPLEVLDEDRALSLGGSKQRAVLAVLVLHANETLSAGRLIDALWGERPPATAAKTMQVHISRLRKALAGEDNDSAGLIATREHGYRLELDPERLDAHRFERLVAQGRGDWPRAVPDEQSRRSRRRCRCGVAQPWRTSRTSTLHRARSPGSRSCGWRRLRS
jgi:DNA-binding winged helix-turn-helix (wHTH) protein